MALKDATLAEARDAVSKKLDAAESAVRALLLAQRYTTESFDILVRAQIPAMREAMGPNQSARFSDNDLRRDAVKAVHDRLVLAARREMRTAKDAVGALRAELDRARHLARQLDLPDLVSIAERRTFAPAHVAMLEAIRGLGARLDRQEARQRVAAVATPEALWRLLQASERSGDLVTAMAAEERLTDRLAAGPSPEEAHNSGLELAKLQRQYKDFAAQLDAHRAGRVNDETRKVLEQLESAVEPLERDLTTGTRVQAAMDQVGRVTIDNPPALEAV
jgi:hypothetical protein